MDPVRWRFIKECVTEQNRTNIETINGNNNTSKLSNTNASKLLNDSGDALSTLSWEKLFQSTPKQIQNY